MASNHQRPDPPTVEWSPPGDQPSREERAADLRVNATLEDRGRAVPQTVQVAYVQPKRRR